MAITPELSAYITQAREAGVTDEAIRVELLRIGWGIEEVNAALVVSAGFVGPQSYIQPTDQSTSSLNAQSSHVSQAQPIGTTETPSLDVQSQASAATVLTHRSRWPIIIGVLVFLGGVAAATVYFAPFFLEKPPYPPQTFLTDLASNLGVISSATYSAVLSVAMEPRTENVRSLRDAFPEEAPQSDSFSPPSSESIITSMIRAEDTYFTMLPSELSASISVDGNIKKIQEGGIKPAGHTGVVLNFSTPDFSFTADVEFIADRGVLYGRINRMPSFLFFNFDSVKGKWVKVGDVASSTSAGDTFNDPDSAARILEAFRKILTIADEEQLLAGVSNPAKDRLGEESVYRYTLSLNADRVLTFYDRAMVVIHDALPEDRRTNFDVVATEQRKHIADPSFVKLMQFFKEQGTLSMWISSKTKLPLRISSISHMAPSRAAVASSTLPSSTKQLKFEMSLSLLNVNQPVEVEVPKDFITLQEAYALMNPTSSTSR